MHAQIKVRDCRPFTATRISETCLLHHGNALHISEPYMYITSGLQDNTWTVGTPSMADVTSSFPLDWGINGRDTE